jgi:hypothetical protein
LPDFLNIVDGLANFARNQARFDKMQSEQRNDRAVRI